MLETTSLGVAFGSLYERDPQMRFGYTHKFGGRHDRAGVLL